MRLFLLTFSVIALLLATPTDSAAHDSNTAMMDLQRVSENSYSLHIRTPLYHLDQAVRREMPSGSELVVGTNLYKKSIAAYLKTHLNLTANLGSRSGKPLKRPIQIGSTALKIGGHETSIILQLKGIDSDVRKIEIAAPLMQQNPLQKNIFRFDGTAGTQKIVLDNNNNFAGELLTLK